MPSDIPQPWKAFLEELDEAMAADPALGGATAHLHCIGGFVVSVLYGLPRSTNDLDIICYRALCAYQAVAGTRRT
jgi:hypothetical protein